MINQDDKKKEIGRGWLIKFLYDCRPTPIEFEMLQELLDSVNHPLSKHSLMREIDFLCSEELIRAFPAGATEELTVVEQAKLIQRATFMDEVADTLFIRLRNRGINLQEGRLIVMGVLRKK